MSTPRLSSSYLSAPGEWVFLLPVSIIRGDVVAVRDPLDPARTVLRRAYAGPGNEVSYEEGTVRVGIKKIRQKEMGTLDSWRVMEDDRDGALDSRWWGTVAEEEILGVVQGRVGTADQRRPGVQWMKPVQ